MKLESSLTFKNVQVGSFAYISHTFINKLKDTSGLEVCVDFILFRKGQSLSRILEWSASQGSSNKPVVEIRLNVN